MTDPTNTTASPGPGGFFQSNTGLLSPTTSQASSARSHAGGLPHPRSHALRPGSAKEDIVRRYASDRILHISRRFVKKFGIAEPGDTVVGYKSMGELCRDVDALLNNLWKSGTPSLQVQYLLNLASELITWMDGFAPSPRATLSVLRKLDYCFASLLGGEDLETKEMLPGFESGMRAGLSRTDMVRCRSIAEQSRIAVVDVFRRGPPDPLDENDRYYHSQPRPNREEPREGSSIEDEERETTAEPTDDDEPQHQQLQEHEQEGDIDFGDNDDDDMNEDVQMGVARVYEFTLVKLGEVLGDGYGRIGDFEPTMNLDDENDDEY